jgi:release factor glutamine methyltransferase
MIGDFFTMEERKIDPEVDWEVQEQWNDVYSPSSDTFLLCDGTRLLADRIPDDCVFLEVGSGSGYATAFARRFLESIGKFSVHFTTDMNPRCCQRTRELCSSNGVLVFPVSDVFATSLRGPIDVIMFNPPYVETPTDELDLAKRNRDIAASWAGGEDGAEVVHDFIHFINTNRSKLSPNFLVILLISLTNRPVKLKRICAKAELDFEVILEKNCQGEALKIAVLTPKK